jgi:hypothetical protein
MVGGRLVLGLMSAGAARPPAPWFGAEPCERFVVTVIDVLPETVPDVVATVAVIVPLPAAAAVKVTGLPAVAEKLPSAGDTDQLGVMATAFPKASWPVALNEVCEPTRTRAPAGVTVIDVSGPAVTDSVCVAPL